MAEKAVLMAKDGIIRERHFAKEDAFESLPETNYNSEKRYSLEEIERNIILQALIKTRNNKSMAARLLAISRQALDRKMAKHGMQYRAIAQNRTISSDD